MPTKINRQYYLHLKCKKKNKQTNKQTQGLQTASICQMTGDEHCRKCSDTFTEENKSPDIIDKFIFFLSLEQYLILSKKRSNQKLKH